MDDVDTDSKSILYSEWKWYNFGETWIVTCLVVLLVICIVRLFCWSCPGLLVSPPSVSQEVGHFGSRSFRLKLPSRKSLQERPSWGLPSVQVIIVSREPSQRKTGHFHRLSSSHSLLHNQHFLRDLLVSFVICFIISWWLSLSCLWPPGFGRTFLHFF